MPTTINYALPPIIFTGDQTDITVRVDLDPPTTHIPELTGGGATDKQLTPNVLGPVVDAEFVAPVWAVKHLDFASCNVSAMSAQYMPSLEEICLGYHTMSDTDLANLQSTVGSAVKIATYKDFFIFTVDATVAGSSGIGKFTVPSANKNYRLYWWDVNTPTVRTLVDVTSANHTIDFGGSGTYGIGIDPVCVSSGVNDFDIFRFINSGDKDKWESLQQWGSARWSNMYGMFWGVGGSGIVGTDSPDTSAVMSMGWMFEGVTSPIDVSGFDTSSVTNMEYMFYNVASPVVDVSGFNTSNVTAMNAMFRGMTTPVVDVSGFDTSKVTTMAAMFYDSTIPAVDVSGFDTSKVTNMVYMFFNSMSTTIDVSLWDTSSATNMNAMFRNTLAPIIDVSGFDTTNVTNMNAMFKSASASVFAVSGFVVENLADAGYMFQSSSLSSADYNDLLVAWDAQALQFGVSLHAGTAQATTPDAIAARANMMNSIDGTQNGWVITDTAPA